MFLPKLNWLCKFFGHHFVLVKDLRNNIKRERVIYRCLRCNLPLIVRRPERRQAQRRGQEGRNVLVNTHNRRNGERRKIYPHQETPHLLHG
jgi:hypothetical protein